MEFKKDPQFIPNPEKQIHKLISDLKLSCPDNLEECFRLKKHSFRSFCEDKEGQKFFLKVRLWDEELIKKSFENELVSSKFFSQQDCPNLKTHQPLKWNLDGKIDWILFKFIPGIVLIKEEAKPGTLEKLIDNILKLHQIPIKILPETTKNFGYTLSKIFAPEISPTDSIYERYLKQIKVFLKEIEDNLPEKEILEFFDQNQKTIDNAKLVLIHGDPMMYNLVIHKNQVYWTDLEFLRPDIEAFDFVSIYNWAWDRPEIRKRILEIVFQKVPNQQEFQLLFRLMLIYQSLYHMSYYSKTKPSLYQIPKPVFDFKKQAIIRALAGLED